MTPLVITVAPNGARRGKADHPALPITPDENNLLRADGSLAPDNAALVLQAAALAPLLGRPLATAGQARALFFGI